MAIVYEQFPSVLIKGYFNHCFLFTSVSAFYYDKNIGYKPGVLTRSVLSHQASFSLLSIGTERKYCRDGHKYDAYIDINKHKITHGVLCATA